MRSCKTRSHNIWFKSNVKDWKRQKLALINKTIDIDKDILNFIKIDIIESSRTNDNNISDDIKSRVYADYPAGDPFGSGYEYLLEVASRDDDFYRLEERQSNLCDFIWIYVNLCDLYDFMWFYMNLCDLCDYIWIYVILYEFMWFYMNLCDFIWIYVIIFLEYFWNQKRVI